MKMPPVTNRLLPYHRRPEDKRQASVTARQILQNRDTVFWDTETTGLPDDFEQTASEQYLQPTAPRLVSFGAVDASGKIIADWLINPGVPIPPDAAEIHGVTDEDVQDAPTFPEIYPEIVRVLNARPWCIYNANFDTLMLEIECHRHGLLIPEPAYRTTLLRGSRLQDKRLVHCAMNLYAAYYGQFSEWHSTYTWQRLEHAAEKEGVELSNAHNAAADALAAMQLIKRIALYEE